MIPSRAYAQYRNKPKVMSWLNIAHTLVSELNDAASTVRNMFDIDNNIGEQLNIIGRIVGVSRTYMGEADLIVTEFNSEGVNQFGDTSKMFSALTVDQDQQMSDDLYRLMIKSKIAKNNNDATIDGILTALNTIFPVAKATRLIDNENMSFSIEIYGVLTNLQRYALIYGNLLPKPQGVRFTGFLEGVGYSQFGDDSLNFGDTSAQFVGSSSEA